LPVLYDENILPEWKETIEWKYCLSTWNWKQNLPGRIESVCRNGNENCL
jgi:hypothetical protein